MIEHDRRDEDVADDALKQIYDPQAIAEFKAKAENAYEERVIKKLLAHVGLAEQAKTLAFRAKEKTGKARVSFEWFYDEHPDFPVYLKMRKLGFVYQVTVKELFNKFSSTPMYKAWEEFLYEVPVDNKPVGLVFDWPGVSGTKMVLHNWDIAATSGLDDGHLRLIKSVRKGGRLVCLEQFEPFLDNAMSVWVK